MDFIQLIFTQFNFEVIVILLGLFGFLFVIYGFIWMGNRKKFGNLGHSVPAKVVDTYLNTIIQNSSALKSSLLRGGSGSVSSVMSLEEFSQTRGGDTKALELKEHEVNDLKNKNTVLQSEVQELQDKLKGALSGAGVDGEEVSKLTGENSQLKQEVGNLKEQVESLKNSQGEGGGGGDPEAAGKLKEVESERDNLKERLQEYEIIEDDLANLKALQKENAKLKEELDKAKGGGGGGDGGGGAPPAAEGGGDAPASDGEGGGGDDESAAALAAEASGDGEGGKEAAEGGKKEGGDKSAQDLLSEFEKMLG